jgi:uncharacterized protein
VAKAETGTIPNVRGAEAALDPWPIPAEWVIAGEPKTAGMLLWQSDDKRLANGIWECSPSSFKWEYTWDETIFLLEGKIAITDAAGNRTELQGGDLFFVTAGTKATWEVSEYVRKAFHFRSETPVEI